MISAGTRITNGHGAVFEITGRDDHADTEGLEYSGWFAVVIEDDGARGVGVYLDDRDFAPNGLREIA